MARGMDLETFLGHKSQAAGGGQFLRGWKKRTPPAINTFLHMKAPIIALWQHNIPKLQEVTDKEGTKRIEVWGGNWNCIEDEDILSTQYHRDRDTGDREHPPEVCPTCRLTEVVRLFIESGELPFAQPIFKWVGDDPQKSKVIHAAGIFNGFKKDDSDLTRKQKMSMKKNSISRKEAWKENFMAKCNYLFVLVDADQPGEGVQIAIETTLVGDKVKEVIRDQMTALGEDDGNPLTNPYCIRWEHRPAEKEFQKKYHCLPMPRVTLSKAVQKLISGAPPNIEGIIAPGNITKLRADFEQHALPALADLIDWDDVFGPAEEWLADQADESTKDLEPESGPVSVKGTPAAKDSDEGDDETEDDETEVAGDDDAETVACDACKGEMLETDDTCPHCSAKYDLESGDMIFDPREKKKEKKAKARRRKKASKKSKAAPEPDDDDDDEDDDDDDEMPF